MFGYRGGLSAGHDSPPPRGKNNTTQHSAPTTVTGSFVFLRMDVLGNCGSLCAPPVPRSHVGYDHLSERLMDIKRCCSDQASFDRVTVTSQRRRRKCLGFNCICRLGGATCPPSAPRNPGHPPQRKQTRAGYLRVVLREEVGPVCRSGHADEKCSLDCEEAENAARLCADRHFPLNIEETGMNKRRTGRRV